jgi:hypothetical protein
VTEPTVWPATTLLHHREAAGATVETESDEADHVEIILDGLTPESLPAAKPITRSRGSGGAPRLQR